MILQAFHNLSSLNIYMNLFLFLSKLIHGLKLLEQLVLVS